MDSSLETPIPAQERLQPNQLTTEILTRQDPALLTIARKIEEGAVSGRTEQVRALQLIPASELRVVLPDKLTPEDRERALLCPEILESDTAISMLALLQDKYPFSMIKGEANIPVRIVIIDGTFFAVSENSAGKLSLVQYSESLLKQKGAEVHVDESALTCIEDINNYFAWKRDREQYLSYSGPLTPEELDRYKEHDVISSFIDICYKLAGILQDHSTNRQIRPTLQYNLEQRMISIDAVNREGPIGQQVEELLDILPRHPREALLLSKSDPEYAKPRLIRLKNDAFRKLALDAYFQLGDTYRKPAETTWQKEADAKAKLERKRLYESSDTCLAVRYSRRSYTHFKGAWGIIFSILPSREV